MNTQDALANLARTAKNSTVLIRGALASLQGEADAAIDHDGIEALVEFCALPDLIMQGLDAIADQNEWADLALTALKNQRKAGGAS